MPVSPHRLALAPGRPASIFIPLTAARNWLVGWVRWPLFEGLLAGEPFRYVEKTVLTPQELKRVRVKAEQEPAAQAKSIRFLPFEDYLLWRNVGLHGSCRTVARTRRGGAGMVNATRWSRICWSTGMRQGDAASLLVTELPPLSGVRVLGGVQLSAAVTSGARPHGHRQPAHVAEFAPVP